jgi:CheY-like chemotaxis protein
MKLGQETPIVEMPHVLVVDDTEVVRAVLNDMLTALGCTVDTFSSGEAVLDHVAGGSEFDFIMMDCQMPHMDGLETTRRLVQDDTSRGIKVVAISAHATDADRLEQQEAGMTEHLSKPFGLRELQALLSRMG